MSDNWQLEDILQEFKSPKRDNDDLSKKLESSRSSQDYSRNVSESKKIDDKKDDIFEDIVHIFDPIDKEPKDEFEKLFYIYNPKFKKIDNENKDIEVSDKESRDMEISRKENLFEDINDKVINYISRLLISTEYNFSEFNNIKEVSQNILKKYYSIDKYSDIINGKYDEDIKHLGSFYSQEFYYSREEANMLLLNNFYYYDDRYKQLFTPDVVVEIITAAALCFMDADKNKKDINKKNVLNNIVYQRLFPDKSGTYEMDSGLIQLNDKISQLRKRRKKPTEEDLKTSVDVASFVALGAVLGGDLLPLALYGGYRLYKSLVNSKNGYEDKNTWKRR